KWMPIDDRLLGPVWTGDDDKGAVYGPLFRGGFAGMEDYIFTPDDGDCTKMKATIRVDWDKAANTVHFLLKGVHFPQSPTVTRTEGETWWPDAFHQAPKDVVHGAYRLWLLLGSTTKTANFYYDPSTLKLLGSDYDFTSSAPPADAPKVVFPIFSTTGSNEFDPDRDGNL